MQTKVATLVFNMFQENTYIVYDDSGECIIVDPGCYEAHERIELMTFIQENGLRPVRLLNTHCHLDHVFGNKFVADSWGLTLEIHRGERPVLEAMPEVCRLYGIPAPEPSPMPGRYIEPGETISFGQTRLEAIYTPGHSPASLSFHCAAAGFVLAGDVLFRESIGRTDLPGGDFDTLIRSIREQLFPLGNEVKVYPGHGPATTIGHERLFNPFLPD
ncbi:MAG: hypothetical protein RLY31_126 [Bacteroidota bacterium]|jgi:glyoxylase-like metal-dependent hydrolase (beta-lactamase superfamily II)